MVLTFQNVFLYRLGAVKEYHINVPAMSSKELLKVTHEDNGEEGDAVMPGQDRRVLAVATPIGDALP